MNRRMLPIRFLLLSLIFFLSCSNLEEGDEVLYLKTDNSYLPIYVRGNKNASTYIIWTHGGPGSSGLYYGDIDEIKVLHNDYRIAYWDQLGSGGSTGNPDKDDYNIDNFSTHQDAIVKIIKNRYNPDKIILLGHSWGGFLASYYLVAGGDSVLSAERQSRIDGLILMNPILDIARSARDSISYIRDDYAPSQIAAGRDVVKWNNALEWYDNNVLDGLIYGSDVSTHYNYIEDAGGMLVQRDRNDELAKELTPQMLFFSPFNFYDYYNNQNTIRTYLDVGDKSLAIADEPNISAITIPTLFLAGENDKIAFEYMSVEWFDLLGTNEDRKFLNIYEGCAHAVFLDAPDEFREDLITFIDDQ
jgi:pimeloyl-ACP methyl ester carboxylesterase